jgi:hypothetical protein
MTRRMLTRRMLLRGLRQRNRAMSEVDVFTTSEKQLRDLAAPLSPACAPALRGLHTKRAAARKHRYSQLLAASTDDTERGKARYITPPYGLRADGPLMTGACAGAASGAGIRSWKAGVCGAGDPRRVVGLRTKPPRPDGWAKPPPCPPPPRAKPGVDPTTQAAASTAAKTRFMITLPHFCPHAFHLIIPG